MKYDSNLDDIYKNNFSKKIFVEELTEKQVT